MSKAAQLRAVGEGLAIGCLLLGHAQMPSGKVDVELSFRKAWRSWKHSQAFPIVKVGPAADHIYYQIMKDSPRRRGPLIAFWDVDRTLRPVLVEGFDLEDAKELLVEFYGIPLEAWKDLAQIFVDELTRPVEGRH